MAEKPDLWHGVWYGYYEDPNPCANRRIYNDRVICCATMADRWSAWCGEDNPWVRLARRLHTIGASCVYYCGVPRSYSAIPLTFSIYYHGKEWGSRLRDLRDAVAFIEADLKAA